jgi:hypothetical protein
VNRGLLVALALAAGCRSPSVAPPPVPVAPLHLQPIEDLAPAAGLVWLVALRPRDIAQVAALVPAVEQLVPEERFARFAERNGGVDLRTSTELVVARYAASTVWLLHTPVDPPRVERAFGERLVHVDGRSLDREAADPGANLVRVWGSGAEAPEELVLFGREGLGLAVGQDGPLRAAELFAERRLKRASPALRTAPLERAAELITDEPPAAARAFAPGPFGGDLAGGLGGLLGACTAVAGRARVVVPSTPATERAALAFTVVLLGAWGDEAPAAADRLLAAFGVLGDSGIGRLLGMRSPVAPLRVHASADALTLEVTLDAYTLAAGLRDATGSAVDAIMGRWPHHSH